jgi:hypothetical protein
MPVDQTTVLHRWFHNVWNNANYETIDELLNKNAITHGLENYGNPSGPERFKAFCDDFRKLFDNIKIEIEETVAQNDVEVARCNVSATKTSNNEHVNFDGICMVKIKDNQIIEAWNYFNIPPISD